MCGGHSLQLRRLAVSMLYKLLQKVNKEFPSSWVLREGLSFHRKEQYVMKQGFGLWFFGT